MKNTRSFTTSAVLLAGCLLLAFPALAKTTLKLSHNQDKSHAVHKAMSYLADKAKAYSDGELNIRIYPNATLGNERESLELMNSGALQMVKVNAASLESFAPEYSVFSLPFLFRDRDHYYNVLKSDLGKRILASSESKGFVGLTWYDGGARSFYAGKPITQPDDLAGMKIRVQQSPSAIAMVKALGGVPTPMAQANSIPRSSKAWSMAAKTTPWFMPICVMRRWRNSIPATSTRWCRMSWSSVPKYLTN